MIVCPQSAISMKDDDEGFQYPHVNEAACVRCGICKSNCPLMGEQTLKVLDTPIVYAFKHKSDAVRMSSSSGGAYTAISDFILLENERLKTNLNNGSNQAKTICRNTSSGVCYGAAFNKNFAVYHKSAITLDERDEFRGSKYVQSNLGDVFFEIKKNLIDGKTVLFTGTACQTAGLSKVLAWSNIDTENLILTDIICTGVPSPKLWNEYVKFLENKYKSKLIFFSFRYKNKGWQGYPVRAKFENGIIKTDSDDLRIFTKLFFSHLVLRPACYHCKFANVKRPSDITIGDFWGIEKCLPGFEDKKGISLVIVNTSKGKVIFDKIRECAVYEQSNIRDCSTYQHTLKHPTQLSRLRDVFWQEYYRKGFRYVACKYGGYGILGRARSFVVKVLRCLGMLPKVKKLLL